MPQVSEKIVASESFGAIEAVKTVADLFAPVSGEIIDTNENLDASPDLVNSDPYGKGWIIKLKIDNNDQINELMNYDEYQEYISDDEFVLDAEIDQSFKVLLEVIEQNV